jgi:lipoate-protein ligase A
LALVISLESYPFKQKERTKEFNCAMTFTINLIKLSKYPIFKLLQFEEAVLRTESRSDLVWIIVNEGTPKPRIIMGSSGKEEELLHVENITRDGLPVIRRFTGGGTVLVDHNTMFATFIGSHEFLKACAMRDFHCTDKFWFQPYPIDVMHWTAEVYRPLFHPKLQFDLLENDYIFKNVKSTATNNLEKATMAKFGGNAQYMTGGIYKRFCHHTSFLWEHETMQMDKYLKIPPKQPKYRELRGHGSFLTNLKQVNWSVPEQFAIENAMNNYNLFLAAVIWRIYDLCNSEWSDHVTKINEYFDLSKFEELREEYLKRENKIRRNSYVYHPDTRLQHQSDQFNIE